MFADLKRSLEKKKKKQKFVLKTLRANLAQPEKIYLKTYNFCFFLLSLFFFSE